MMQALTSSETSDVTRAKRRNITEDAILPSHRRENLKAYKAIYECTHIELAAADKRQGVVFQLGGWAWD
jgi:hypothetical protein